jgi:hypothetical protein
MVHGSLRGECPGDGVQDTAIGGVFFKAQDPEHLYAWYEKHLGLKGKPGEGVVLPARTLPLHD